jgi:acetate kinase
MAKSRASGRRRIWRSPIRTATSLPMRVAGDGYPGVIAVRRYGFHGLSHEYIISALFEFMPDCAEGKLVVAHLGNGASMCAIDRGRSVAATTGFTSVDGLPMGTGTGALDPGVILYLLEHERADADAIEKLIYQRSSLLGVSGISSDMRTLLVSNTQSAKEAADLFVYRIGPERLARGIGTL